MAQKKKYAKYGKNEKKTLNTKLYPPYRLTSKSSINPVLTWKTCFLDVYVLKIRLLRNILNTQKIF